MNARLLAMGSENYVPARKIINLLYIRSTSDESILQILPLIAGIRRSHKTSE